MLVIRIRQASEKGKPTEIFRVKRGTLEKILPFFRGTPKGRTDKQQKVSPVIACLSQNRRPIALSVGFLDDCLKSDRHHYPSEGFISHPRED